MTYKQLVKVVENICLNIPDVRTFIEGDVYTLNSITPTYEVMCLTLQNRQDRNGFSYYRVVLFYVDRLKKDLSNEQEIISSGIEKMDYVMETLKNTDGVFWDETQTNVITPFRQRFADETSGVYAEFTIPVINEILC